MNEVFGVFSNDRHSMNQRRSCQKVILNGFGDTLPLRSRLDLSPL